MFFLLFSNATNSEQYGRNGQPSVRLCATLCTGRVDHYLLLDLSSVQTSSDGQTDSTGWQYWRIIVAVQNTTIAY